MRHNLIRWTKVRGLGGLQILTRASYILLVAVPLLAALWPGVKIVINQYNKSITSAVVVLEHSATRLEFESERIDNYLRKVDSSEKENGISKKIRHIVDNLEIQLNEIKDNVTKGSIEKDALPATWAILFFSSLFVFIAHLIYQISAPDLIKEKNIEDYISLKKEEYSKNPNERTLKWALDLAQHPDFSFDSVPDRPEQQEFVEREIYEDKLRRWEMDVIEQGSQALYMYHSQRNPVAIVSSGVLYLVGIFLILWVIKEQSLAVAKATGWIG